MKRLVPMLNGSGLRRTVLLLVCLCLVAGLLLASGCGSDEDTVTFPQPDPEPPYPWFYDVYGTGPDDVWIAGNVGVMYHFEGAAAGPTDPASWTKVDMGTDKAITTIWGAGDGTLYACGYNGQIWRNTGGTWSGMSSGTDKDLLGIGSFQSAIHTVGRDGVVLRLDGNNWSQRADSIVTRNPKENNAIIDRLSLSGDVVSLVAVNHYMLGGAYLNPDFEGEPIGIEGTVGFHIKEDTPMDTDVGGPYEWLLTQVVKEPPSPIAEWVICTISDDTPGAGIQNNWFGTSQGWLFRLTDDLEWVRYPQPEDPNPELPVTTEERYGVRDLWLAPAGDLYIVTDDGLLVRQMADGTRETLYDQLQALVSIWGTGPDNMFLTGYMDEQILHVVYDPLAPVDPGVNPAVTKVTLEFPDTALKAVSEFDELGRRRH